MSTKKAKLKFYTFRVGILVRLAAIAFLVFQLFGDITNPYVRQVHFEQVQEVINDYRRKYLPGE